MTELFFEGIILGLMVAISIGPAFFAVIQTGIKGFRYGLFLAIGISLSDIAILCICYLIGASIFDEPGNKVYVGLVGGIILIIFGSISWVKKPDVLKRKKEAIIDNKQRQSNNYISYVIKGFLINVANPFVFFFWFAALGFVGKNAPEGKIMESTLIFFSGTFLTIFSSDLLKSFIGVKIKRYLKPRKEIILNKIVGIALVIFGVVLIFRTLDDYGFFQHLKKIPIS